jgi:hypothetical protein
MTTTPETWTRYPRSTDPAKDVAALVARLNTLKRYCQSKAYEQNATHDGGDELAQHMLGLCNALDREHDEWIAQRGVEAVRKAVMPEGEL